MLTVFRMKPTVRFLGFWLLVAGSLAAAASDESSATGCQNESLPLVNAHPCTPHSNAFEPFLASANWELFCQDEVTTFGGESIHALLDQVHSDRTIVAQARTVPTLLVSRSREFRTEIDLRQHCLIPTPDAESDFGSSAISTGADISEVSSPRSSSRPGNDASIQPVQTLPPSKPADVNQEIYYKNKLEFSLEGGWHPINVPFPLDVFVGDAYNTYPLKYTLVPIFASLRWHMGNIWGPRVLRGNFDFTFTGSITGVARGPENHYFAYLMGIRRNFVPRNSRIAPYFDIRLGVGRIDSKGPLGVVYAQGQDITFTINMGSGVRYNFSPRYSISGGLNYMHISNLDLSESNGKPNWGVRNYGINVYGPMVGLDIQLRRRSRHSE